MNSLAKFFWGKVCRRFICLWVASLISMSSMFAFGQASAASLDLPAGSEISITITDSDGNEQTITAIVLEDGSFENIKDFKVSGLNLLKRVDRPK